MTTFKILAPHVDVGGASVVLTTVPGRGDVQPGVPCLAFRRDKMPSTMIGRTHDTVDPRSDTVIATTPASGEVVSFTSGLEPVPEAGREFAIALALRGYRMMPAWAWASAPVLSDHEFTLVQATAHAVESREAELDDVAGGDSIGVFIAGLLIKVEQHGTAAGDREGERALLDMANPGVSARHAAASASAFVNAVGPDAICAELGVGPDTWQLISHIWVRAYTESYVQAIEARGMRARIVEFIEVSAAPAGLAWTSVKLEATGQVAAAGVRFQSSETSVEITASLKDGEAATTVQLALLRKLEADALAMIASIRAAIRTHEGA